MPAFTFEKLSPSAPPRVAEPVRDTKPRGKMAQFLDRIARRGARKSDSRREAVESRQAEFR